MFVSMCSGCQEQIISPTVVEGPWFHTVWGSLGEPPEMRDTCPTVPNSVATPTEGMIIEINGDIGEGGMRSSDGGPNR